MVALPTALIVNGGLLVASIILAFFMLHAGVQYGLHTGNPGKQFYYRRILMRAIVGMIGIGLGAAIFNLFFL